MDYQDFLTSKLINANKQGFDVSLNDINEKLYDFQRDIVRWALSIGKAALFEECGLGKTPQQLEWARHVAIHTGSKVLILTPLAVAHQTIQQGIKFGIDCGYYRSQKDADESEKSIIVTNYDMLDAFDETKFGGIVLDESSILKNYTGKIKNRIIEKFRNTKYKLACSATPAPNDHLELGNHADFLGIMPSNEMISRWFVNDSMRAGGYRLKKHAQADFWRWVTSWAVCLSEPSDLGYENNGFKLPPLKIDTINLYGESSDFDGQGALFSETKLSATSIWKEKRRTIWHRAEKVREIINKKPNDYWIIWVETDNEADEIKRVVPEAIEVRGSQNVNTKQQLLESFSDGSEKIIITKASLAGFGLNWQHCRNQIFTGMSYSFERFYQALRRSWRFMVEGEVDVFIINYESERNILDVVKSKRKEFEIMQSAMNEATKEHGLFRTENSIKIKTDIQTESQEGKNWKLYLGDCIQVMKKEIEKDTIDFSIFSPPFSNLYIYSDSIADMGNCKDDREFFKHFSFLPKELLRITKPGRLCAVHCKDLPLYMNRDGAAGLRDFPGMLIRAFERGRTDGSRWAYHSRVTIWKDPVIEMQRTKNHGLLHRNFTERSEACRQGMADYILVFRKWSPEMPDKQVTKRLKPGQYIGTEAPEDFDDNTHYSIKVWQKYASPVWFDINQTHVLNKGLSRDNNDEKHICPLQLDVIDRCLAIWTNEDDTVFSPYAGIGSEGYESIKGGRKFIGVELKKSYFDTACKYLRQIETYTETSDLFQQETIFDEVEVG